MNALNNKTRYNKKNILKFSTLVFFVCLVEEVNASGYPFSNLSFSFGKILFNEKTIYLLVLLIIILLLIAKTLLNKKRRVLVNKMNNMEKKQELIEGKVEFKYPEITKQVINSELNIELPRMKDEVVDNKDDDISKTVLLSKVVIDLEKNKYEKMVSPDGEDLEIFERDGEEDTKSDHETVVQETENKTEEAKNENETEEAKNENLELSAPLEDESSHFDDEEDYHDPSLDDELLKNNDEVEESEEENKEDDSNVRKIGKTMKNIIDKTMELKKREISDIAYCVLENILFYEDGKIAVNTYVEDYVREKYMKQCEHACKNAKALRKLINVQLEKTRDKLIANVNRSYSDQFVHVMYDVFVLINKIDCMDNNISKYITECNTLDIIDKNELIKKINKIYKIYYKIYYDYLSKLNIEKFKLICNRLETNGLFNPGDLIMTNISSSIQFSKIFSEYIIDKTYSTNIILEDLREVQLKFISFNILEDMLHFNYRKKYIINFPISLYSKEKKLASLLAAISDVYSQNKVFILIDVETLKECNEILLKLKKQGFKFIIEVSSDNIKLYEDIKKQLSLVDYIVYVGNRISKASLKDYVPSYLIKKIIYPNKSLLEGVVIK